MHGLAPSAMDSQDKARKNRNEKERGPARRRGRRSVGKSEQARDAVHCRGGILVPGARNASPRPAAVAPPRQSRTHDPGAEPGGIPASEPSRTELPGIPAHFGTLRLSARRAMRHRRWQPVHARLAMEVWRYAMTVSTPQGGAQGPGSARPAVAAAGKAPTTSHNAGLSNDSKLGLAISPGY